MTENQSEKSHSVEEVERVIDALRQLVDSTRGMTETADAVPLFPLLRTSQQLLNDVYERLAELHATEAEEHRQNTTDELRSLAAPAWARVESALSDARSHGGHAAGALERAGHADAIAQWYDEELSD